MSAIGLPAMADEPTELAYDGLELASREVARALEKIRNYSDQIASNVATQELDVDVIVSSARDAGLPGHVIGDFRALVTRAADLPGLVAAELPIRDLELAVKAIDYWIAQLRKQGDST